MRYLLGGYYGMRNVGDDVLLYVSLAEVMRVDPQAAFTIISHRPEAVPAGARVTIKPGGQRFGTVRDLLLVLGPAWAIAALSMAVYLVVLAYALHGVLAGGGGVGPAFVRARS